MHLFEDDRNFDDVELEDNEKKAQNSTAKVKINSTAIAGWMRPLMANYCEVCKNFIGIRIFKQLFSLELNIY